tara:strand:+ start:12684 stop:13106 length:423 start_codon:yes stop_codon:yes gene_type:complete
MFNKDLIYICKHVEEWPEGVTGVSYDADGEIVFKDSYFDFYPEGLFDHENGYIPENFLPAEGLEYLGKCYPKEEFLACKEYLYQQENPSVAELQDVVSEKVISRIKEIRKRHTEDYKREITPLVEVLQRRGVSCDEFIEF